MSKPDPQSALCDAMTYDGARPCNCVERREHTGPHRYGELAWTDVDHRPRRIMPNQEQTREALT